jgi:predicted TIM-barrel fold metal-dependent hydrolase
MKIIDCHGNIGWDISNIRKNLYPTGQTVLKLLSKMDYFDVGKAVIVPFPSPGGQFTQNAFWYDLENHNLMTAARSSSRLIPFPGVNPNDKDSVKNIKTLSNAYGIKGIKFSHQIPMNFSIEKLIKHPLMKIVQDHKLIMMVHVGTGKESGSQYVHTTLNYAIKVAKYYPNVKFIFCHLGRLHKDIFEALQLSNVWMDTAGFSIAKKWSEFVAKEPISLFRKLSPEQIIEHLVSEGYEDKIIFGSDEPYTNYNDELKIIQEASISDIAKQKILAKNIENLLNG